MSIVASQRPEVALLGAPPARIEDRCRGLVDEQLGRAQQLLEHQPPHRLDLGGAVAGPERQGGAIDGNTLPRQDLRLAVQRTMVGVFGDDDVGDQPLGRQPTFDQPGRRRRLDDRRRTGAAGIFRPARDESACDPTWT